MSVTKLMAHVCVYGNSRYVYLSTVTADMCICQCNGRYVCVCTVTADMCVSTVKANMCVCPWCVCPCNRRHVCVFTVNGRHESVSNVMADMRVCPQ